MALKASYEFLFVGKDDNSFLENYSYDLFQDYGDKSGQIFVNLEVQNNPVDAEEIGSSVFETIQKVFFEDVGMDPYDRFEISLKAINEILNEFKNQKTSGYIGNLNIIVAAIVDDTLYLTQTGDSEAYLIRNQYVSIVSEGLSDEAGDENEVFTNIASGKIESGDFVLFSSARLLRYISKGDLAKCVKKKDIPATLDDIKEIISTEMLGRIGLTGIFFETVKKEDIDTIEEEVDSAAKTILESSNSHTASEKESITGRFFTALKKHREKREEREERDFEPVEREKRSGDSWLKSKDSVFSFFNNLFSGGLGKSKFLIILVVIILFLIIAIFIAKGSLEEKQEIDRLNDIIVSVQDKIAEAQTQGAYDKEGAKLVLDKAYEDALMVLNSGNFREKASTFLTQIEEIRDGLDNVERVENPKLIADLTTKNSNANALGFAEINGRVFVFEYNALYEIVLDQIQDPLTIDDEETVIAATGFEERDSIIFLTESGKLLEYRGGTMSFMDTDDGIFHKAVSVEDWSNNIYLLDPDSSQIWKYPYKGTRNTFASAEGYFVDAVDISKAKDFAIDANVYVLQSNGDILKFYGGNKTEFYINDAPFNPFNDPTVIYTSDALDEILVLDSKASRILIFEKEPNTGNATYVKQYMVDGVGELRDVYVDNNSRNIYVLTESKIFEISL